MSSQEKNVESYSLAGRLRELRLKRQWKWAEVAVALELSEPMVYALIAGKTGASDKTIYRLEQAEKAAGIEPPLMLLEKAAIEQGLTDTLNRQQLVEFKEKVRARLGVIKKEIAELEKMVAPVSYTLTREKTAAPVDEVNSGKGKTGGDKAARVVLGKAHTPHKPVGE